MVFLTNLIWTPNKRWTCMRFFTSNLLLERTRLVRWFRHKNNLEDKLYLAKMFDCEVHSVYFCEYANFLLSSNNFKRSCWFGASYSPILRFLFYFKKCGMKLSPSPITQSEPVAFTLWSKSFNKIFTVHGL